MQQKKITTAMLLVFTLALFTTSCKKNIAEKIVDKNNADAIQGNALARPLATADFQKLADTLAFRLRGRVTGYTFIISYQGQYKTNRAGGQCRKWPDVPARAMTMYEKYSIASVTKTITAAALIKKMSEMPGGIANLDAVVWKYLPSHWVFSARFKTITFRQLLNHTSGIYYGMTGIGDGDDYQTLKKIAASNGLSLYNPYVYNNRNYDLMRLLIPKIANYNIPQIIISNIPAYLIPGLENAQASQYANAYKDYCRLVIFNKLGTTAAQTIDCVNTDAEPGLCYMIQSNLYSYFSGNDRTLVSGSQGWVLNTVQINDFFTKLQYTQTLLPYSLSNLMKNNKLGYDFAGNTTDGISCYWKNGIYDFVNTTPVGGYRSLIIGFGDDIQITMMANSAINLENAAIAAHQDWHP